MKIVRGLDAGRKALCSNRGLDLSTVPPSVQESIERAFGEALTPQQVVSRILSEVRERGDDAVRELTRRLDGVEPGELEVPRSEIADAHRHVPDELLEALELVARRVRRFHEAGLPQSWFDEAEGYGEQVNPVDRVGAYIPGGTATFPSTVLMTAVPARVAGVGEVILCTPGSVGLTPVVLAAAEIAGVDRVFRIGGAQAIAAMAYGTESVPGVDMICGPGGIFVTLAKKQLFGEVGIDGLYGPTETVIVADDTANPTLCAADLVAQAEHDVLATPVLITTSEDIADSVRTEARLRASRLQRAEVALASLEQRGYAVVVDNIEEAIELANEFAPEHLCLMVDDPWRYRKKVRGAGAVFLGEFSHEVLGDYVAGPSHVMPTGGTARFSSGISARSFIKVSPVVGLDADTASVLSRHAARIARAEGFTGHAESAEIRDELFTPQARTR